MKNKKLLLVILIFVFLLGLFGYRNYSKTNINKVLESKSYSYLPKEAKSFVKKVYKDSGNIILTEKNKKENVPYLNPDYISFLTMSEKEQESVSNIPDIYKIDYIESEISGDPPSTYDLRNVNGKNFITPLKDQKTFDLCWAFTAAEQAESFLLKKANINYTNSTQQLSPRQLDYSLSHDGIANYRNDIGIRKLTSGGNYYMAMLAMSNGVGLTKENTMPFDMSTSKKYLQDVMPYRNDGYELNSSIRMGALSNPTSTQLSNFVSNAKNYVMTYGGAFVSTQAPDRGCGATNTDGTTILRVDNKCSQNYNHAMQIIGWDDSYTYSYCASGSGHTPASGCASSSKVTGTGAWILRNSWGEDTEFPYVYLAYDSLNYQIDVSTDITPMSNRKWDNNYHEEYDNYYLLLANTTSQYFKKKINTPEKIEKVKFFTYGENASFILSITSNDESYKNIKSVTVPHAGLYTIDLSNENIVISDSGFNVELYSTNNVQMIKDSIEVFTSNVENNPIIQTADLYLDSSSNNYQFTIYSDTKEIPSSANIIYDLKNQDDTSYSSYLTNVIHNKVANNALNTDITINKSIPAGDYILTTTYNSIEYESTISLGTSLEYTGTGTQTDPYIINSEEDLINMSKHLNAHYKLGRDINLTQEWVPIGTKEKPFTGSLNGNGKTISNIHIDTNYDDNGLFGYVEINKNNTTSFSNIILDGLEINAKGNAGALIGTLSGETSKTSTVTASTTIQDIYVMDGYVYSTFGHAGAIVGSIVAPMNDSLGKHTYNFNRLFNASCVGGLISTGMIGHVYGSVNADYAPTINMQNIENMGSIDASEVTNSEALFYSGSHGTMVGYGVNYATISLNYYFANAFLESYTAEGNVLTGYLGPNITYNQGTSGYSIFDATDLSALTNSSSYASWPSFNTNWELKTIDGIKRFPVIKGVPFEYTYLDDIELAVGETVSISEYMSPSINASYKITSGDVSDESIIEVEDVVDDVSELPYDVEITGLEIGTSELELTNFYDGFYKTINVTVTDPDQTVITYHNIENNDDITYVQKARVGEEVTLTNNRFSKTGYTFKEWNTSEDGEGTSYQNGATFDLEDNDLNLYAQWIPNTYTIKYDSNNGTGSMQNTSATYDKNVTLRKNTFTNAGHTFIGWNTKADGTGTSYTDEESVKNLTAINNGTVTLYAQWNERTYFIAYDGNGSTAGNMTNTNAVLDTPINLKANTYERTGYHFTKWNTKADGTGKSYDDEESVTNLTSTEGGTVTLYAQWAKNTYKIVYDSNGGDGEMNDTNATYGENVTLRKNIFTRAGYKFMGWNTKEDGTGKSYTDEESVKNLTETDNGTVTLYAQWNEKIYYIVYNGNGSTSGNMTNTNARFDTTIYLKENTYVRTGYHFTEWNTKADGSGTSYDDEAGVLNIAANPGDIVVLYAQWQKNKYKISYDSNGGDGEMNDTIVNYGEETTLTNNAYTKTGYRFSSWNTKADGSGTTYTNGQSIKNLTNNDDETITLYAQWLVNSYTIKYNSNGGNGSMSNTMATYDKNVTLRDNKFTKSGFYFAGWNTAADGSGDSYSNGETVKNLSAENNGYVTLYAQWSSNGYTIIYNSNGGEGTMPKTIAEYGETITLSDNEFTRVGYKFKNWNTKADGTGTSYSNLQSVTNLVSTNNGSITLYAIWEANSYMISFHANGGEGNMSNLSASYGKSVTLPKNTYTRENYVFASWNTKADGTGTSYTNGQTVLNLTDEDNETVVLYAQWREKTEADDTYEITYAVDNDKMVLDDIPLRTTLSDYKNHFELGDSYTMEIDLGNKNYIYTGSKVKIYKNGTLEAEYTNVVRGDVNGDTKISALDYVKVKNHIMGSERITNTAYSLAADYNHDNKISALDYVGIKNYIMNGAG